MPAYDPGEDITDKFWQLVIVIVVLGASVVGLLVTLGYYLGRG